MANIASILKSEITRLARKEVRAETDALKAASSRYRADIAALKRQIAMLDGQLRRLSKTAVKTPTSAHTEDAESRFRFSAKGLAAQRRRLGLSAEAFGTLIGVTGQSVYKWEAGKAKPRASQLPAIAAVRALGKREATVTAQALAQ